MKRKQTTIFFRLLILAILFLYNSINTKADPPNQKYILQSEREIPVIHSVDVVVIGGSTAAVSAAVAASEQGAKVFLLAPKPYLGEDMCATLRLEIDENRKLKTEIEKKIFNNSLRATPLEVKSTLSEALVESQVDFIFNSFVTDILWDKDENPAGIVVGNRAGRQAIKAKIIIDATDRAWICRMAGADVHKWDGKEIEFQRIVVMPGENEHHPKYVQHSLKIPMPDINFPSFAQAEQIARKKTYTEGQLRAAESLFHIPPDPIVCNKGTGEWKMITQPVVENFKVKNIENLFVLSGSADIPRLIADSLLQPAAMCEIAALVGQKSALLAKKRKISNEIFFKTNTAKLGLDGDIKEVLDGLRPTTNSEQSVMSPKMNIPVLGNYDIVVIGGGTSGAPAAIAASFWGMKVLVVEFLEGLGGIGTLGLIGKPWHGKQVGFAAEVPFPDGNIEPKMEWYRSEFEKYGGDIWLGVLGAGAFVNNNLVKGAVVITPEGRGIITANVVIDATGNADIAIAAGADYMYGDIENNDIALQGTGLSSRPLTGNYYNSDYLLVDETDMIDVWRTLISVQITKASENMYDVVPIIQNRERRRIVGEYILTYLDQISGRTFPDAIVFSSSSYDSHGYPSSPYFALLPHDDISRKMNQPAPGGSCFTPYRSLLPQNLNGILVTGLGISMDRDASAMVRMQLDMANQGYAAGVAAMLSITNEVELRDINIKELQQILIKKGNLPDSVLDLKDSYPFSEETIEKAVTAYGVATNPEEAGKPLAIILSHKERALPFIKIAHQNAEGHSKLLYAKILGMLGQQEGVSTLLSELKTFTKWDEKIYQGSMADYAHLPTPIDAIILALGNSGDITVLPTLLKFVDKLDHDVTLSHHRSVALALEKFSDPSAALPLARLLQKPGMQGHAMHDLDDALTELDNNGKGPNPVKNTSYEKRTRALREIMLARVLYMCGDYNDIGKIILENYQHDMQSLFARHATHILNLSNLNEHVQKSTKKQ